VRATTRLDRAHAKLELTSRTSGDLDWPLSAQRSRSSGSAQLPEAALQLRSGRALSIGSEPHRQQARTGAGRRVSGDCSIVGTRVGARHSVQPVREPGRHLHTHAPTGRDPVGGRRLRHSCWGRLGKSDRGRQASRHLPDARGRHRPLRPPRGRCAHRRSRFST